jgi:hypothetical protein
MTKDQIDILINICNFALSKSFGLNQQQIADIDNARSALYNERYSLGDAVCSGQKLKSGLKKTVTKLSKKKMTL